MGCNYYVQFKTCEHCNNTPDDLHIGKSSMGWTFSFHAIPGLGLTSWKAWKKYLVKKSIVDEYGRHCYLIDFVSMVERKTTEAHSHAKECRSDNDYLDPEGHSFSNGEFS